MSISTTDIMRVVAMRMAERGPGIRNELTSLVGGLAYSSGHAVDYLMTAMSEAETALLVSPPDADAYVEAIVKALFLARDIAIREGKIVVTVAPSAKDKPS